MLELPISAGTLLLLAALAVPLTVVTAVAQEDASIRLDPSALTLRPGQSGQITVCVDNVTDLAGAEVHLTYDPEIVDVVDADAESEGIQVSHGGFLSPDFVALNQASSEEGTIDYAVAQMLPHTPASGGGPLTTITLRGVKPGETILVARQVLLADRDGYPIPIAAEPAAAVVTVSSGRLLPNTCWPFGLVAFGVAACVAFRRRPRLLGVAAGEEFVQ